MPQQPREWATIKYEKGNNQQVQTIQTHIDRRRNQAEFRKDNFPRHQKEALPVMTRSPITIGVSSDTGCIYWWSGLTFKRDSEGYLASSHSVHGKSAINLPVFLWEPHLLWWELVHSWETLQGTEGMEEDLGQQQPAFKMEIQSRDCFKD